MHPAVRLTVACVLILAGAGSGCTAEPATPVLHVYKNPGCTCCDLWAEHMRKAGFEVDVAADDSRHALKAGLGISPRTGSCHTAVMAGTGYVFEGHVPAPMIRQFLASPPPAALGLAVPGMPLGSPGMEVGARFNPYQVLTLYPDGRTAVFADVTRFEQQHGIP